MEITQLGKVGKGYTVLRSLLTSLNVDYTDSGSSMDNLGKQVCLHIQDEQSSNQGVSLYFDINVNGFETFVCQE